MSGDGFEGLYLDVLGESRAGSTPLLLIHGGAGTIGAHFGEVLPQLSASRQVIGVELQGHGHSPFSGRKYTFENNADDVAATLAVAGWSNIDVLGFSNGGPTAIQLAVRHPALARRLVVVSGFSRRDGFIDGFWDGFEDPTVDETSIPQALLDAYREIDSDPEHLQRMFELDLDLMRSFTDRPDDELRELGIPALFVGGDRDIVQPAHTVAMASLAPQGRALILPGGHGDILGTAESGPVDGTLVGSMLALIERFLDQQVQD